MEADSDADSLKAATQAIVDEDDMLNISELKCSHENGMACGTRSTYELNLTDNPIVTPQSQLLSISGCYCGDARDLSQIELQCCVCCKYFHRKCIKLDVGPIISFTTNYQFFCRSCSAKPGEYCTRKNATFSQLCVSALANLTIQSPRDDGSKAFFSKDKDIIPFIDANWEGLTPTPRRVRSTWHVSITKSLAKDDDFACNDEGLYALRRGDLENIGPVNEALKQLLTPSRGTFSTPSASTGGDNGSASGKLSAHQVDNAAIGTRRANKRRPTSDSTSSSGAQRKKTQEKQAPICFPSEFPANKDSYRYHLAEPDPNVGLLSEDSPFFKSSPTNVGITHRAYIENLPALSLNDKGILLQLSHDRLVVTGSKGYSMIRGISGVAAGIWYYEAVVTSKREEGGARIGWAGLLGAVNAPCGFDKHSYSWRLKKGTAFHQSRGHHTTGEGYDVNDVLGFLIHLPCTDLEYLLPKDFKELPLIRFRNHVYFEEHDETEEVANKMEPLPGSKIEFFKNGVHITTAFTDIYENRYYPAVSLYKNTTVRVNFGPKFRYPMTDRIPEVRPMSEALMEDAVQHTLSDILFYTCSSDCELATNTRSSFTSPTAGDHCSSDVDDSSLP